VTHITVEDREGIALVRIDRPPANAMDPGLLAEGAAVLDDLRAAAPDAVVLTGTGRFFSGGVDLDVAPTLSPVEQRAMVEGINRVFTGWYGYERPVVAAVNGHAVAGGMILALCADLRVVGASGRFGITEIAVGIPYPVAAMAVVQAEIPQPTRRQWTLTGVLVDAAAATAAGVFDEQVADDLVLERALLRARELGDLPRAAYGLVKRQLRGPVLERLEQALAEGSDPMLDAWVTPDARR
jgi:enoyl-CoA hydratase/carnithine racemase